MESRKIQITYYPGEPDLFAKIGFWDLSNDVVTRLINQDNLNVSWFYDQVCDDCFNELMQVGTIVRICKDWCCNIFLSPGGKWVEVGSYKDHKIKKRKSEPGSPLRYPYGH